MYLKFLSKYITVISCISLCFRHYGSSDRLLEQSKNKLDEYNATVLTGDESNYCSRIYNDLKLLLSKVKSQHFLPRCDFVFLFWLVPCFRCFTLYCGDRTKSRLPYSTVTHSCIHNIYSFTLLHPHVFGETTPMSRSYVPRTLGRPRFSFLSVGCWFREFSLKLEV